MEMRDELQAGELELLAAYVDAGLSPGERAQVEALLARSEAARAVLADLIRLEEAENRANVAGRASPVIRRFPLRWGIVATAAAAVVVGILVTRPRSGFDMDTAMRGFDVGVVTASAQWRTHPWPSSRAAASAEGLAAAFRAGTLWFDFNIALAASDDAAVGDLASELRQLLQASPLSAAAVAALTGLEAGRASAGERREAMRTMCEAFECNRFEAGALLEAVRLWTIADGDATTRRDLVDLSRRTSIGNVDGDASPLLQRLLQALADADRPPDAVAVLVDSAFSILAR